MSATSYVTTWTPDQREEWMGGALCAETDPDMFFPEKGGNTRPPKAVCAACPVREQCLAYALRENITDGIWGGLSPRERRALAEPREAGRPSDTGDEDRLRALHARGLSGPQIAELLGCSARSATRALARLGLATAHQAQRQEKSMPTTPETPAPAPVARPYDIRFTKGQPGERVPAHVTVHTDEHGDLEFWTVLEVPA